MVEVNFFVYEGDIHECRRAKWKYTDELHWDRYYTHKRQGITEGSQQDTELIEETFERCLKEQFGNRYKGLVAVCLRPYHEHSHPQIMLHKGVSDES